MASREELLQAEMQRRREVLAAEMDARRLAVERLRQATQFGRR